MTLYQRPAFLVFGIALCVFAGLRGLFAAFTRILAHSYIMAAIFTVFVVACTIAGSYYAKRLRAPPAIATFTPLGVTNESGETFTWSQMTKMYKFAGCLFLKDDSKRDWIVRLDPAEVGFKRLAAAIAYIKSYAPSDLTQRI